ncbi:hypothetical protein QJS10_CPB17g00629 [Acorus calamus]|uniref:Uncharacterized protein n=1 Tax=Acorus calamus TaxID=4465 RepID=A0AAV9CZF7_ACOCL|nr:hypothetical protein QJS10_CPB17g00629 [Acorus calamus]
MGGNKIIVCGGGLSSMEEMKNAEKAIQSMGASMLQLYRVESFGPYGQRTAAVYLKDRPTPKIYPRLPDFAIYSMDKFLKRKSTIEQDFSPTEENCSAKQNHVDGFTDMIRSRDTIRPTIPSTS